MSRNPLILPIRHQLFARAVRNQNSSPLPAFSANLRNQETVMKNACCSLLLLLVLSLPLTAQVVLYDNGADPGNIYGWLVSNGHSVTNSFKITTASTVTAINVSLYDADKYNIPQSLDWRILKRPMGQVIAFGTASNMRMEGGTVNEFLFFQWLMQFDVTPTVPLPPGTYWLEISNASNLFSTGVFWGECDGPSMALVSGTTGGVWKHGGRDHGGSESFQIMGFPQ